MFKQFNGKNCRILRDTLHETIASNEKLQDLEIKIGNMIYADTRVTIKLEFSLRGAKTRDEEDLEKFLLNWAESGTKIVPENKGYTLTGYKSSNRKYPFLMTDPSGKSLKTTFEGMRKRFCVLDVSDSDNEILDNALKPLDDLMERHQERLGTP